MTKEGFMLSNIRKELGLKTRSPGIFHKFIAEKLIEKVDDTNIMRHREVRTLLYCHTIPIQMQERFLKELEGYGLIKILDKQNIEVLNNKK